jgi:hypothetical protein
LADQIQPGPRRTAGAAKIKAGSGFHEEVSRPDGNEKSELGSWLQKKIGEGEPIGGTAKRRTCSVYEEF